MYVFFCFCCPLLFTADQFRPPVRVKLTLFEIELDYNSVRLKYNNKTKIMNRRRLKFYSHMKIKE